MPRNKLYTIALCLSVALVTYFLFAPTDRQHNQNTPHLEEDVLAAKTIATIWQRDKILAKKLEPTQADKNTPGLDANTGSGIKFDEEAIFQALQSVKLDEDNNVILDNDALEALNSALESKAGELTEADIERLQSLIEIGLPGIAGEQTAEIVGNFYNFLVAKQSFNALYEGTDDDSTIDNVDAGQITDDKKATLEARYQELKALRELYLGNETTAKLFAVEDANARYMFNSLQTETNPLLSFEEKQRIQAVTIAQHEAETLQITDWTTRQQAFLADKQQILAASISDADKQRQLTELLNQHFTREEREKVKHLSLDEVN